MSNEANKIIIIGLSLTDTHIQKLDIIKSLLGGKENRYLAARTLIELGYAAYETANIKNSLNSTQQISDILTSLTRQDKR